MEEMEQVSKPTVWNMRNLCPAPMWCKLDVFYIKIQNPRNVSEKVSNNIWIQFLSFLEHNALKASTSDPFSKLFFGNPKWTNIIVQKRKAEKTFEKKGRGWEVGRWIAKTSSIRWIGTDFTLFTLILSLISYFFKKGKKWKFGASQ